MGREGCRFPIVWEDAESGMGKLAHTTVMFQRVLHTKDVSVSIARVGTTHSSRARESAHVHCWLAGLEAPIPSHSVGRQLTGVASARCQ
jgi:hypothetical protein